MPCPMWLQQSSSICPEWAMKFKQEFWGIISSILRKCPYPAPKAKALPLFQERPKPGKPRKVAFRQCIFALYLQCRKYTEAEVTQKGQFLDTKKQALPWCSPAMQTPATQAAAAERKGSEVVKAGIFSGGFSHPKPLHFAGNLPFDSICLWTWPSWCPKGSWEPWEGNSSRDEPFLLHSWWKRSPVVTAGW